MAAHVVWPDGKENAPVHIEVCGSSDEILRDGFISTFLKSAPVQALGVVIDADDAAAGRYDQIRKLNVSSFPALPPALPREGVVETNAQGKRFGVWIMPDNATEGYLELFLRYLVPSSEEAIWQHGVESVTQAVKLGAPIRPAHVGKANLYTWLAWQDPPGRAPGVALMQRALDPTSNYATPFVEWFKRLYELH